MTEKREGSQRFSLARWSQRKLESAQTRPSAAEARANVPAAPSQAPVAGEAAHAQAPSAAMGASPAASTRPAPVAVELPPVESLTFDSDFTAFLRPEVDPDLKRAALKQLFRDPSFNVMDGLDVYIDDYSKPDPIPPDMLAELVKRFDLAGPSAAIATDQGAAESGAAAQVAAQSGVVGSPIAPAANEAPRLDAGAAGAEGSSESSPELAPVAPARASGIAQDPAPGTAHTGTGPGETTGR